MRTVRIIPCLDLAGGRVVKGVQFENMKDAGDPVEVAKTYSKEGADELVFLDISATVEQRKFNIEMFEKLVKEVDVPITIGGGVNSLEDADRIMSCGATRVSINSAAVKDPSIITAIAEKYGNKAVVVAIDCAKNANGRYDVLVNSGKTNTHLDVVKWASKVEKLGAGTILLTSMDRDGTQKGYNIEITKAVTDAVSIPVIASGGAGKMEHFVAAVKEGGASAVLAASLFHYKTINIKELKRYMKDNGIEVNL